ncbi:MAG: hypothetical protein RIS09_1305, partial [Actinomycetota bacterium]
MLNESVIDQILDGRHFDPHSILGAHLVDGVLTFRVIQP